MMIPYPYNYPPSSGRGGAAPKHKILMLLGGVMCGVWAEYAHK